MKTKKNNSKAKERSGSKKAAYRQMKGERKRQSEYLGKIDIDNLDQAPDYPSFEKRVRKSSHAGTLVRGRTERRLVKEIERERTEDLVQGLVLEVEKGSFLVHTEKGVVEARIPRRMLQLFQSERNFLTVGDRVSLLEKDDGCELLKVEKRKNVLKRKDSFHDHIGHAMAANVDRMMIVSSYREPEIKWGLIDRFLVATIEEEIEPCIVINKVDLTEFPFKFWQEISSAEIDGEGLLEAFLGNISLTDSSIIKKHKDFFLHPFLGQVKHYLNSPIFQELVEEKELAIRWEEEARKVENLSDLREAWLLLSGFAAYKRLGYSILFASAATGEGTEMVKREVSGKICLFCGHSGVGKSSMINAIDPDFDLKTSEVSSWEGRGRHTTSSARLLPFGDGFLIDTPGIRTLETKKPQILAAAYPEFASHSCRFATCTHTHETECGVKEALKEGDLSFLRYRNYRSMLEG